MQSCWGMGRVDKSLVSYLLILFLTFVIVVQLLSHVQLFAAPWTVTPHAPLSMGFPRSGLPFPSLGDLPNPGTEPRSSALAGRFFTTEPPGKPSCDVWLYFSPSPLGYAVSPDPFIKTVTPQKLYALSQEFSAYGECKNFLELF